MKTRTTDHALWLSIVGTTLLVIGCDNQHLIGTLDAGQPPAEDGGSPAGMDARPPGVDAGSDAADAGGLGPVETWTGYIENYTFPSGSDVVRLSFAASADGEVVGTVTLGSGTPPPPPVDPNVGYPADLLAGSPASITLASNYIAEGFGYSIRAGTFSGGRLRFGLDTWELWAGWCALQTPVTPQGTCDEAVCQSLCLPNWGFMSGPNGCGLRNPATDQYEPVDCGRLALCSAFGVCICDASGCAVRDSANQITFDVTNVPVADLANGSITGQLGDHNVHFTRDP